MQINDREFPVVVQAYQPSATDDLFVAEQVVNNQHEANNFTSRYAGYLIKARTLSDAEIQHDRRAVETREPARRRSSAAAIWGVILLLLVAIVVVGFTTGWIQKTFNVNL
jgi:uncharacterized membrane protein YcjF (UPF0283 family)